MTPDVIAGEIARTAARWLEPSAFRSKSVDALSVSTGYSKSNINNAIDNSFKALSIEKLNTFIFSRNLSSDPVAERLAVHIAASNVFTSWLHGVVITLMMGFKTTLKLSRQEPVFGKLFLASFKEASPRLAERMSVVEWDEHLIRQADAVIAYGSDQSLAFMRRYVRPDATWVGYGHKLSVAVAFCDSVANGQWPLWQAGAADDIETFELDGCLSPQWIFVEKPAFDQWSAFVRRFAKPPQIEMFDNLTQLIARLSRFRGVISCVGVAGAMAQITPAREAWSAFGVSRICPLGEMQRPPLEWRNGGIDLAETLQPMLRNVRNLAHNP